jgi:thioredoxin reductase (NADPH)
MIYDLIIIGAGPAALSAAIYAGRSGLTTLALEKDMPGGLPSRIMHIANYPAAGAEATGPDIMAQMVEHARVFNAQIKKAEVVKLDLAADIKNVTTVKGDTYEAYAVIIATGTVQRGNHVKGESEFTGHGVSYCAVCDGAMFREQDVLVQGKKEEEFFATIMEEAVYLAGIAAKVYITMPCAKKEIKVPAGLPKNIAWLWQTHLLEILGEKKVEKVLLKNNKKDKSKMTELDVNGVFFFGGAITSRDLYIGQIDTDDKGYIITDDEMTASCPGIFAAGDVRHKTLRQIVTAVSDGAIAAVSAHKYIQSQK